MTDDQLTAEKALAGDKKPTMKRRDDNHDYSERRMYMITLETEGRCPLFGTVVGDANAPNGSQDEPRTELTALGKAVQQEWLSIPNYYPQIEVVAVQMMPDHMHGILFVKERLPVHLGQVISGFKAGCRKAVRAMNAAAQPQPTEKEREPAAAQPSAAMAAAPQPSAAMAAAPTTAPASPQATAVPSHSASSPSASSPSASSPSVSSPSASSPSAPYRPLFAKGYNDLILRSYDELAVWRNYLRENPRRLLMKRARPEWLRPFFGLKIGEYRFSGLGNRALLTAPWRKAVRVSRRLNEAELTTVVAQYLEDAQKGCVLVSPAISPGEKRVMRAAFDAGLPTIVIVENGFTPMTKPHGERFYACAQGRLLLLSPWEHHNEKRTITAAQCQQMNLMALKVCE